MKKQNAAEREAKAAASHAWREAAAAAQAAWREAAAATQAAKAVAVAWREAAEAPVAPSDDDGEPTAAEVQAALEAMYDEAQHYDVDDDSEFNCVCVARRYDEATVAEFLEYVIEQRGLHKDHTFATEDSDECVVKVWSVHHSTYVTVLE